MPEVICSEGFDRDRAADSSEAFEPSGRRWEEPGCVWCLALLTDWPQVGRLCCVWSTGPYCAGLLKSAVPCEPTLRSFSFFRHLKSREEERFDTQNSIPVMVWANTRCSPLPLGKTDTHISPPMEQSCSLSTSPARTLLASGTELRGRLGVLQGKATG